MPSRKSVLVVRLDSVGDVLLAGPAVRAVAAGARRVTLLTGPRGRPAAALLPGVDDVLTWPCPWVEPEPGPVRRDDVLAAADAVSRLNVCQAVILTSFHQDPLPTALLLRLAGVPRITAACEDYPGTLLDVRHRLPETGLHEVERMLSVAGAAGFPAPADSRLRLRLPICETGALDALVTGAPTAPGGNALPPGAGRRYVVLHPGASVPSRAPLPQRCGEYVDALSRDGWRVVVTGGQAERPLTASAARDRGLDLGGRTTLTELAAVLAGAAAVVTGNTGPAHLAAAVGTPVVSLFAPTVPAERWRPWGVPHVLLGAQDAPCTGTRAKVCPVPGHPCLADVTADAVAAAVRRLAGAPAATVPATTGTDAAGRPLAGLAAREESA